MTVNPILRGIPLLHSVSKKADPGEDEGMGKANINLSHINKVICNKNLRDPHA